MTGRVMANGEGADWLQVEYEGRDGYVYRGYLAAFAP